MVVLVTCKYEEDPIKKEGARVLTRFSPIITLWELSVAMETIRDIMVVLVTCKYEEDPIKNEGSRVLTRFSPL